MMSLAKLLKKKLMPHQNTTAFEPFLRRGWHRVESNEDTSWVWSLGRAELLIPPAARTLELRFDLIARRLAGQAQHIRFFLDDTLAGEIDAVKHHSRIVLRCAGHRLLRIETEALRPCDYPGHDDTRPLGICLWAYLIDGKPPAAPAPPRRAAMPEIIPNTPPQTLQVEITTACHLKCVMCTRPAPVAGVSPHMTAAVWERFFRAARQVENVNFLGNGESLLHPRFTTWLRQLDEAGVAVAFSTAGDMVDARRAADLAALEHHATISVSIDSPDPAVYQGIRGQALERALRGLDCLIGAVRRPERVRVVAVVMRDNLESLLGFPALLAAHGVRQFVLRGVIDSKGSMGGLMPAYDERDLARLREIKADCERRGIAVSLLPSIPEDLIAIATQDLRSERTIAPAGDVAGCGGEEDDLDPAPLTRVCFDPWETAIVTRDGLVQPCEVYHYHAPLGSLAEHEFDEIWTGEPYRAFRASLLRGQATVCANCPRRHAGRHPLALDAAELLAEQSSLGGPGPRRLRVRNLGRRTWTRQSGLNIAAARPKNRRDSALYHPSWLQPDRIGSFKEERVAPGEIATFEFEINRTPTEKHHEEHFQLVIEGNCWLPNTGFMIAD